MKDIKNQNRRNMYLVVALVLFAAVSVLELYWGLRLIQVIADKFPVWKKLEPATTATPAEPATGETKDSAASKAFRAGSSDDPFIQAGWTVVNKIVNPEIGWTDIRYTDGVWNINFVNTEYHHNELCVTKYLGSDTEVVIPAAVAGYRVKRLDGVFMGHPTHFAKVTIPAGVEIMDGTFLGALVDMIVFEKGSEISVIYDRVFPMRSWLLKNEKINIACEERVRHIIGGSIRPEAMLRDFEFTAI